MITNETSLRQNPKENNINLFAFNLEPRFEPRAPLTPTQELPRSTSDRWEVTAIFVLSFTGSRRHS